jgi:hypothetical protein
MILRHAVIQKGKDPRNANDMEWATDRLIAARRSVSIQMYTAARHLRVGIEANLRHALTRCGGSDPPHEGERMSDWLAWVDGRAAQQVAEVA